MENPRGASFLAHAPAACARLASLDPANAAQTIATAEAALAKPRWFDEIDIASWLLDSPDNALAALAVLSDPPRCVTYERLAAVVPELAGLAVPHERTTYEHAATRSFEGTSTPLLDMVMRAIHEAKPLVEKESPAVRSLVVAVLLFADVAKGGTPEQRSSWRSRLGVDGAVHNEDSAEILGDAVRRVLHKAPLSEDGRWSERARLLCEHSGLVGMRLRGEVGRDVFADFRRAVEREADGGSELTRAWSIVNRCTTAAVRADLWTDDLARAFETEERAILQSPAADLGATPLAERLARVRFGPIEGPKRIAELEIALNRLRGARGPLEARMARCRLWYAEAALGALHVDAMVRLLAHLSGAAAATGKIDTARSWHLDLLGVVSALREEDGSPLRYHTRLLEAVLDQTSTAQLNAGELAAGDGAGLVSFPSAKGGEDALVVRLETSPEASALLTLLPIYESKTAASFHTTLKSLCDLYGLRKDDFDRVANEAAYLSTMNAARADKSRLLDFVKEGTIVEVGPGGGVVLGLLRQRFPDARVVGLDASTAVVEAHKRRHGNSPPYEMIHGDAFLLTELFGTESLDTVVFCSVLHEIFSYVVWPAERRRSVMPPAPDGSGPPSRQDVAPASARFRIESVLELLTETFRSLKPGGRVVVRDGVKPPEEPVILELKSKAWRDGLDLFAENFEARPVPYEVVEENEQGPWRVRLAAPDAYELMTTLTWGPASFPYEIREQRAIQTHAQMTELIASAAKAAGVDAKMIDVPAELASYTQPGYVAHLEPYVSVFDAEGKEEIGLPKITGVWVAERS